MVLTAEDDQRVDACIAEFGEYIAGASQVAVFCADFEEEGCGPWEETDLEGMVVLMQDYSDNCYYFMLFNEMNEVVYEVQIVPEIDFMAENSDFYSFETLDGLVGFLFLDENDAMEMFQAYKSVLGEPVDDAQTMPAGGSSRAGDFQSFRFTMQNSDDGGFFGADNGSFRQFGRPSTRMQTFIMKGEDERQAMPQFQSIRKSTMSQSIRSSGRSRFESERSENIRNMQSGRSSHLSHFSEHKAADPLSGPQSVKSERAPTFINKNSFISNVKSGLKRASFGRSSARSSVASRKQQSSSRDTTRTTTRDPNRPMGRETMMSTHKPANPTAGNAFVKGDTVGRVNHQSFIVRARDGLKKTFDYEKDAPSYGKKKLPMQSVRWHPSQKK